MDFSLKNNTFQTWADTTIKKYLTESHFSDVTLVSEDDHIIQAHKLILSSSSEFFHNILTKHIHPNPLIFVKGISHDVLRSIVTFIYSGETMVPNDNLDNFMEACKELRIKGVIEDISNITATQMLHTETDGNETKDPVDKQSPTQIEKEYLIDVSNVVDDIQTETIQEQDLKNILIETDNKGYIKQNRGSWTMSNKSSYHTPSSKPKNISCTLCDYKIHRKDLLKLHMNSKHDAEKFFCQLLQCEKVYSSKINLKNHMKNNHECNVCGKVLISIACLKDHRRNEHINGK